MRLILQVVGDDRIIVLVAVSHPRKCRKIIVCRNTVGVPQVHHMSARVRLRTMDINDQLQSIRPALSDHIFKDLQAVHPNEIIIGCLIEIRIRILTVRPL